MATAIIKQLGGGIMSDDCTAQKEHVLINKTALTSDSGDEIVSGEMPNNSGYTNLIGINSSIILPYGYHDGNSIIVQELPTKSEETFQPSTNNQIISSGRYLTGRQIIKGDPNLRPENIRNGVTIFGVTGSFLEPSGFTIPSAYNSVTLVRTGTTSVSFTIETNSSGKITAEPNDKSKCTASVNGKTVTLTYKDAGSCSVAISQEATSYYATGSGVVSVTCKSLADNEIFNAGVLRSGWSIEFEYSVSVGWAGYNISHGCIHCWAGRDDSDKLTNPTLWIYAPSGNVNKSIKIYLGRCPDTFSGDPKGYKYKDISDYNPITTTINSNNVTYISNRFQAVNDASWVKVDITKIEYV